MPSQKQLQWSQLKVGLTVIFASVTLGVLLFLMSGTGGLFTPKLTLKAYFDNASGLRKGAPVRLSGVDIGNVKDILIIPSKQPTPVEVTMTVSSRFQDGLHKDSLAELSTAGVLGETYIDIDSSQAKGAEIQNGRHAASPFRARFLRCGASQPEHTAKPASLGSARGPDSGLR